MNDTEQIQRDPALTAVSIATLFVLGASIAVASGWRWRGEPQPLALEPLGVQALITLASFWIARWHRKRLHEPLDNDASPGPITISVMLVFVAGAAFINLFLAGAAALSGNPDKYWICAFLLPGAAAAYALTGAQKPIEAPDIDTEEIAKYASEAARQAGWRVIHGYLLNGIIQAVSAIAGIALLIIGTGYFTIIKLALLEDKFIGWSILWEVFPDIREELEPQIFAIAIAIPLVMGAIGLGAALWGAYIRRRHYHYDRDLSDEEHTLIKKAYESLDAFLDGNPAPRLALIIYWGAIIGMSALLFGASFLLGDSGLGAFLFENIRAPKEGWYIYNDGIGGSDIVGFFLIIFFWFLPFMALSVYWPALGIYSYRLSKAQSAKGGGFSATLWKAIAVDVRKGNITSTGEFNPEVYIRQSNKTALILFARITLAMAAVYVTLWVLDRMDYQVVSAEGITYREYLSRETLHASYNDIEFIDVACRKTNEDNLILRYKFNLKTGATVPVVWLSSPREFREQLPPRLGAWREADALARAAGVHVVYNVFRIGEEEFNRNDCRSGLSALVGDNVRDQVMPLIEK